jgi:hypothetical protein
MAVLLLGVPLFIACMLVCKHYGGGLTNVKYISRYGVIFEGFNSKAFLWQVWILIRRWLLVIITVMLAQGTVSCASDSITTSLICALCIDRALRLSWLTFVNIFFCLFQVLVR